MKPYIMNYLRKCQFPVILACEFIPIPLLLLVYLTDTLLPFAYAYTGLYILLTVIGILLPGKLRPYFSILGCLLILGLSGLALMQEMTIFLIFPNALYLVLFMISMQIGSWGPEEELHTYWIWTGVLVHLIAQFLMAGARNTGIDRLEVIRPVIMVAFFVYMFFAMLSLNRGSMSLSSMGRQKVAQSMKGKNVVFTLVVFGISALIALVPPLIRAGEKLLNWVVDGVGGFIVWIIKATFIDLTATRNESVDAEEIDLSEFIPSETNRLAEFMQNIALTVIKLAFFALMLFALFVLLRFLFRILKKMVTRFIRYNNSLSEDYEDEITDTREDDDREVSLIQRLKNQLEPPDDPNLPPSQRIRRRFMRILRRHPEWAPGSTAREKLSADSAALYERARYSNHPISEEEAARFQSETKRV